MRVHPRGRRLMAVAAAGALFLTAAGCGGDDEGDSNTVVIWSSMDPPVQEGLEAALVPLAEEEGITIDWQRVDNINQLIMTKIQANDTPDIAFIPQPGVVGDIVERNAAQPLDDVVDVAALEESMIPGTLDAGTVDDQLYGLLVSSNIKSLVFYPKKAWEEAGFQAPETLDELVQLTDQMRSDGETPWCMGIESDTATGWPATDWFEDLVMRFGGADVYNQWVQHEIPFTDDVVVESGEYFEELMFTEGNVLGGQEAITSTNFGTAGNPMFDAKPGCWMYKQGSFITGFFPENVVANLDEEVGVFGFPPAETGGENPVLGGGDMAVLMSDSEQASTVMEILSRSEIGDEAPGIEGSTFVSPHKDFALDNYPTELQKQTADIAYQSTAFLFDGSDQMPGEVGAGSFWRESTEWITGNQSLDEMLQNIEDSWPE